MSEIAALNILHILQPAAPVSVPAEGLVSLVASVESLPQNWQTVANPLEITALLTSVSENGGLSLQTGAGNLALTLLSAQDPSSGDKTSSLAPYIQQLSAFVALEKPVNLILQAGAPPSQAVILLPSQPVNAHDLTAETRETPESSGTTPRFFAMGDHFSAVALSEDHSSLSARDSSGLPSGETIRKALAQFFTQHPEDSHAGLSTTASNAKNEVKAFVSETANQQQKPALQQTEPAPPQTKTPAIALKTPEQQATSIPSKTANPIAFKIVEIDTPAAKAATPPKSGEIRATVVGKSSNDQVLLRTDDDKILYVREKATLPNGSRLLLARDPDLKESVVTLPNQEDPKLTALRNLAVLIQEIDPALSNALFQNRAKPSGLPTVLMFVMSALKQGNVTNILGASASERLDRIGKRDLLAELADGLQQTRQTAHDGNVGQWQSWPMPVYDGQQFRMLHLYVHEDPAFSGKNNETRAKSKTRFLIDVSFSRLGRMQIDGLSNKKQLDLIIRSESTLPENLPRELQNLYLKTIDAVGLVGTIAFQTGPRNWIQLQQTESVARAGVLT